jgi:hypothetical protein
MSKHSRNVIGLIAGRKRLQEAHTDNLHMQGDNSSDKTHQNRASSPSNTHRPHHHRSAPSDTDSRTVHNSTCRCTHHGTAHHRAYESASPDGSVLLVYRRDRRDHRLTLLRRGRLPR